jgi:membrane-associated phospholipid phosphatase
MTADRGAPRENAAADGRGATTHTRRSRGRAVAFLAGVLCCALWSEQAAAEAAPAKWRSPTYYVVNGQLLILAADGAIRLESITGPAGADWSWFPGDLSLRGRCNPIAAKISDASLIATAAAPAVAVMTAGSTPRAVNAELVYADTLASEVLLNSLVKVTVRRPRPYTYASDECVFREQANDADVSFYSGHSSTSFAAAMAGSYLFAEGARSSGARAAGWGLEFALASATANLRLRAGKHYYSDVLVGALVGSGLGILVPLLHGAKRVPTAAEKLAAGAGLVVGTTVSQLLPVDAASPTKMGFQLLPFSIGGCVGLQVVGTLQ